MTGQQQHVLMMFWSQVRLHADCVHCGCRSHNWKYIPQFHFIWKLVPASQISGVGGGLAWPRIVIVMRTVKTSPAFVSAMFGASSAVNTSSSIYHTSHTNDKFHFSIRNFKTAPQLGMMVNNVYQFILWPRVARQFKTASLCHVSAVSTVQWPRESDTMLYICSSNSSWLQPPTDTGGLKYNVA